MKRCSIAIMLLFSLLLSVAELSAQDKRIPFDIKLWEKGFPNSNGRESQPTTDPYRVNQPEMRVFLPESGKANGKAVIILPGGGYTYLAFEHEGYDFAPFYNDLGVAVVVLKYRMPHGFAPEVPLSDVEEAFRITRENASGWNINPSQIGIMGLSAGGHLSTSAIFKSGKTIKPAFQVLLYPIVSMQEAICHEDTRKNLLGDDPTIDAIRAYSSELNVDTNVPPTIIFVSSDDQFASPMNSFNYYFALQEANVRVDFHIYPQGGHGWGAKKNFPFHKEVFFELTQWIKRMS